MRAHKAGRARSWKLTNPQILVQAPLEMAKMAHFPLSRLKMAQICHLRPVQAHFGLFLVIFDPFFDQNWPSCIKSVFLQFDAYCSIFFAILRKKSLQYASNWPRTSYPWSPFAAEVSYEPLQMGQDAPWSIRLSQRLPKNLKVLASGVWVWDLTKFGSVKSQTQAPVAKTLGFCRFRWESTIKSILGQNG